MESLKSSEDITLLQLLAKKQAKEGRKFRIIVAGLPGVGK